jgi:hypothetical protein
MTGKQSAVMWLGLLLIVLRLFTTGQWSALWDVVNNGESGTGGPPALGNIGAAIGKTAKTAGTQAA